MYASSALGRARGCQIGCQIVSPPDVAAFFPETCVHDAFSLSDDSLLAHLREIALECIPRAAQGYMTLMIGRPNRSW